MLANAPFKRLIVGCQVCSPPVCLLQLGAECLRNADDWVTHVVATNITDKTRWAEGQVRTGSAMPACRRRCHHCSWLQHAHAPVQLHHASAQFVRPAHGLSPPAGCRPCTL
jgi:hypothetical protein